MSMRTLTLLAVLATICAACKEDEPEPEPEPCELYCDRTSECCETLGLIACDSVRADCENLCSQRTDHVELSGLDTDSVEECMLEGTTCMMLVGMDDTGYRNTYTDCLAAETGCAYTGSCTTDGETQCCENALASCNGYRWQIQPCPTVCYEAAGGPLVTAGSCDDATGTMACNCGTP